MVLFLIILPSITYTALLFSEEGMDTLKSLYPVMVSLNPRSSYAVSALSEERSSLEMKVSETVGPHEFETFPHCVDISK
ncbi:hypothetical protein BKA64DRAFT_382624 [Cadophora sp. MPI-SDFR-AT-0126]|nr:hypothetical protein BKA64DRAFT_382624 [Leotiomycetes sp. MPI-SDFR-AT-0126]